MPHPKNATYPLKRGGHIPLFETQSLKGPIETGGGALELRRMAREGVRKKRPASAPAKPAWGSAAGRSWSQFKAGHKAMQVSTEYIETGYVEKAKILREYKRIPEDHADFKAGFTGCSAYSTGPYGKARKGNRR